MEIGPTNVLANMAKKTAARQHFKHDNLNLISREFLSFVDDAKKISYQYDDEDDAGEAQSRPQGHETTQRPSDKNDSNHLPAPISAAAPIQEPLNITVAPVAAVKDTPLSATDIVLALTSQKLKKAFDNMPLEKSIRELSGGGST